MKSRGSSPQDQGLGRICRDGLDLPDATWQRIVDAGALCGVQADLQVDSAGVV
jgi:hypothetical protein